MIRNASAGNNTGLNWFKSSYSDSSNGEDCLEVAHGWQKSSHSDSNESGDCVEIAATPRTIHVRDSKAADGPCVTLTPTAWSDFLTYASRG
ncbi:DUF397 domain-containing protein [Streptomyces sp. NPDC050703]|uniref:DUF397 domain-containing protein n=1 Tax=Streptomyces sp. NPDC050703 TaxID=3157218 RepID=UPI00343A563D